MATHDYVIDNSTGANVRSDINNVLQAILTNNSSSSAPSTTAAYMWWADTTNGILKIRNSANDGWVELLQLDGTLTLEDGAEATPALAFRDDLNTGIFSPAADTFAISTAGSEALRVDSSGNVAIGIATAAQQLHVDGGSNDPFLLLQRSGAGDSAVDIGGVQMKNSTNILADIRARSVDINDGVLKFSTMGSGTLSERCRIDNSGRLLIGLTSSVSADGNNTALQVCGTTSDPSSAFFGRFADNANAPFIMLAKSRNGTVGGNTVLQTNDQLGVIAFLGNDGSGFHEGARITAVVESGVGNDDLPTALTFKVNTGSTSVVEKMKLDSLGRLDFAGDDNNSTGTGVLRVKHYAHSSNLPVNMIGLVAGNGFNNIHIGGNDTSYTGTAVTTIRFYTASDSTTANGTEAARFVNTGDLVCHGTGLNNSSVTGQALQISGTTRPTLILRGNASGSNQCEIHFADNSGSDSDAGTRVGMIQYDHSDNNFRFTVNETARVKIQSKGGIHAEFNDGDSLGYRFKRVQGSNSHNLLATSYSSGGIDGGGTESFVVQTDGDVQNLNNSYGQISDIKYKENIVDATSQWEDIKAIKVRNFNFKAETNYDTHTQIGVVAQELETVSPKLITTKTDFDEDGTDLGTTTKVVKYSVLYMKAIKALQEAITKIEVLETKVAALEAA